MNSRGLRNETPGHGPPHIVANTEPRRVFPNGRPRVDQAEQPMGELRWSSGLIEIVGTYDRRLARLGSRHLRLFMGQPYGLEIMPRSRNGLIEMKIEWRTPPKPLNRGWRSGTSGPRWTRLPSL
jgi:hypothetical protein